MSTKIDRMMASSETAMVNNPKGNLSNTKFWPSVPELITIQPINRIIFNAKNILDPAEAVTLSDNLSLADFNRLI